MAKVRPNAVVSGEVTRLGYNGGMDAAKVPARRLWSLLEPIHAVTYFSPEPLAALKEAGYRGFWMGYFAGRAAPLGRASAELVHAVCYNFAFEHVARAIPSAWDFAAPDRALSARLSGSVAALQRLLAGVVGSMIATAADLAARAAATAPLEGRPLFAANRSLPEPERPLERLWHAATLLREHRGDGHVAALVAAGIGGRQAHVLHALATGTPVEVYARARTFEPAEWTSIVAELRERGLVDGDGTLTAAGRQAKDEVEELTDELAESACRALSPTEVDDLIRALLPITTAVVSGLEIPTQSPMGLNLNEAVSAGNNSVGTNTVGNDTAGNSM